MLTAVRKDQLTETGRQHTGSEGLIVAGTEPEMKETVG
jgi:hypothetical protein